MFSLQTIFGKGDKFYGLLEASAGAARESARALGELLSTPPAERSLERFKAARQLEKDLQAEISQQLVHTFVTALEREDIEELSGALYKIPKVVEKFAERYALASERVGDVDFIPRAAMLERACTTAMMAKMKSVCASGRNDCCCRPFPMPTPSTPPAA